MVPPTKSLLSLALCSLLIHILGGSAAWAQASEQTVAVLEVTGAPRAQAAITAALKGKYTLVPLAKWNAAAKRLNAPGRAPDELAIVAAELKVGVVVTGAVKKDKETNQWGLTVSARQGETGKSVDKLRYPLKGRTVDGATLRKLAEEIVPAVEKAFKGPEVAQPEPAPAQLEPVADAQQPGKDDDPFEKLRQEEEEEKRRKESVRPVWYPWVDVGAGFVLGGRRFSFDEDPGVSPIKCYDFDKAILDPADTTGNTTVYRYTNALKKCPGFAASVAPGLRVDATVYPLAFLKINPLRGLGVGGTFDVILWPASRVCNKNADGTCVSPGAELETRELRAEVGLRWQWNIMNKRSRPSVRLMFQYGLHQFAIQKQEKTYDVPDLRTGIVKKVTGVDDHGLPDILYQYLDLGLGGRVPYYANNRWYVGMLLDFHYHIMLSYGDIQTRFIDLETFYGGYGPVSGGYGLRLEFTPFEFVWKGLTARLQGYYEAFSMSFELANADRGNQLPPIDRPYENASRHIAQGASDHYFGGVLQVGYQY